MHLISFSEVLYRHTAMKYLGIYKLFQYLMVFLILSILFLSNTDIFQKSYTFLFCTFVRQIYFYKFYMCYPNMTVHPDNIFFFNLHVVFDFKSSRVLSFRS